MNVIFDQSSYVRNAISGLTNAGLGGLILVVVALILFLGNFRSAMIVSISLPLSVLFAFIVLYFTGQAINIIILGGVALVLGLLVDNSIVVLENIDRHSNLAGKAGLGKTAWDASLAAASFSFSGTFSRGISGNKLRSCSMSCSYPQLPGQFCHENETLSAKALR